jgi:hypothetical protein
MKTKVTLDEMFDDVREACNSAHLVAFDGCHKIYLAMDETQAQWFRDHYNGTSCDDRNFTGSAEEMYELVVKWYEESCPLRFINSVETNEENPNLGYTNLVPQGAEDEDYSEFDDEEEEF